MRKTLLAVLCAFALGTSAFADGLINFLNNSSTLITLSSSGISLGLMPTNLGQFKFELFVAPTGTTDSFQFLPTGVQGTNRAVAGRFLGGNNLTVAGVQPGLNGSILVRGWSTSLGNDYSTAFSLWHSGAGGFLGESEIASPFLFGGDDGSGPIPPSPAFGPTSYQINNGFVLSTIPEPSFAAFTLFSGAALCFFKMRHGKELPEKKQRKNCLSKNPELNSTMKTILASLTLAALVTSSSAQGLINFVNSASTLVTLNSNGVVPTPPTLGMFKFELFTAPAGTLNPSAFVGSGIIGTNIGAAGRLNGGNALPIPGRALGGTCAILVRGWSTDLGNDWATAYANAMTRFVGWYGESSIAPNFLLGGDGGAGFVVISSAFTGSTGFQSGFSLYPVWVPEPSSLALTVFGFGFLRICRQPKKHR